jgi:hypothetical protein
MAAGSLLLAIVVIISIPQISVPKWDSMLLSIPRVVSSISLLQMFSIVIPIEVSPQQLPLQTSEAHSSAPVDCSRIAWCQSFIRVRARNYTVIFLEFPELFWFSRAEYEDSTMNIFCWLREVLSVKKPHSYGRRQTGNVDGYNRMRDVLRPRPPDMQELCRVGMFIINNDSWHDRQNEDTTTEQSYIFFHALLTLVPSHNTCIPSHTSETDV